MNLMAAQVIGPKSIIVASASNASKSIIQVSNDEPCTMGSGGYVSAQLDLAKTRKVEEGAGRSKEQEDRHNVRKNLEEN